ncbi:heavy metal transport/detoxification protein [Formosa agariphila KMM 3901]|uniref:Heavy metal transport/detoxification protein n=1 Tax=Formosa agariphila (strain DSM 15362 / KCTC 12365 / LMG 23005 / KMM 3901 / M-2Alg 35-1) TaxID=1347342 RepID=T2KR08_FORAG|nr:heavy metal-associated domain-containing protein [Formosa agariphila]CDF80948.1 heavy metal transport/detoxification protein [Formosa agariphila KMM 3901]
MKHFKILFAVLLLSAVSFSCKNKSAEPEIKTVETAAPTEAVAKTIDPNATYAKAEFTIEGMTCQIGCANTIEKKLSKLDGIKSATVSFDKKLAMVEYDVAKVNATTLEETVTKAGEMYSVTDMKTVDTFDTTTTNETETSKQMTCKGDCEGTCDGDCKKKSEDVAMACSADGKEGCCASKKA